MNIQRVSLLIIALVIVSINSCDNCSTSLWPGPSVIPTRKGTTYRATVWPSTQNDWAGKMACDGCNPVSGDTLCTVQLPVLCILHSKELDRPYYFYEPQLSSYQKKDGGFYNPWTGGVLVVTDPIRGLQITNYAAGDQRCKDYYGPNAKFAQFYDGFYMDDMNGFTSGKVQAWEKWNWANSKKGSWSLWGYFNHHWRGQAWIWVNNQPNGNCGQI